MAISRADRRERQPRAVELFGPASDAALDVLELLELAWHDSYGEPTPPDDVIDDIWTTCNRNLTDLIFAARLAVTDRRDLRMNALRQGGEA